MNIFLSEVISNVFDQGGRIAPSRQENLGHTRTTGEWQHNSAASFSSCPFAFANFLLVLHVCYTCVVVQNTPTVHYKDNIWDKLESSGEYSVIGE